MNIVQKLTPQAKIHPPSWLPDNIHYLAIVGSEAYGASTGSSDIDIYGFCAPPLSMVFPHLAGEIPGFGRHVKRFEQWQEAHVKDEPREYDFTVYSIVKYFQLCMENNPNMVDSLFVPQNCVLHATRVGQMVRENRELFLHKGCWHKFKGYAFSQKSALTKTRENSHRHETIEKYGYDVKHAYHLVRLMDEVEQILESHTLDLQRNSALLRAVRTGEWSLQDVEDFFAKKEKYLETVYQQSTLRYSPDEPALKELLIACLEDTYGSLDHAVSMPGRERQALEKIYKVAHQALYKA
jgi:predicted nucleotidyltransferase